MQLGTLLVVKGEQFIWHRSVQSMACPVASTDERQHATLVCLRTRAQPQPPAQLCLGNACSLGGRQAGDNLTCVDRTHTATCLRVQR